MKIKIVLGIHALICLIVTLAMFLPLGIAIYDRSYDAKAFAGSIAIGLAVSFMLALPVLMSKEKFKQHIGIREGVGVTGFSWVIASAIGALPHYLAGVGNSYADAFFETMSGFSTTGATILTEIEILPRGILLWRSLTHWMGGMGIIVLSLAVLPFLGLRGIELYKAEVPGVTAEKLTPRLQQTAKRLWSVYVMLTLLETFFLWIGGMSFFDAFAHSCSTIATGGFSTKNNSIAFFNSAYIEWIIIIFMFVSGINFSLFFLLAAKKFRELFEDEELKIYIAITLIATGLIVLALYLSGYGVMLREVLFHVVSVMTTTGFITRDYNLWPEFTKCIFLILMLIGASGGSTGGGFKVSRIIILFRQLEAGIMRLLHPRAVIIPRFNGRSIQQSTLDNASAFFVLYMLILVLGTLLTTAFGVEILTAFSGVLTCLSNVGPGLNSLGPVENFSHLPDAVKWLFSFCMLAGRLELFAVILLLLPKTYMK